MGRTLLLNWVYYRPVGHVVEALKVARGFAVAEPDLEISVLLNADSAVELTDACPWIGRSYAVDTHEVARLGADAPALRRVPRVWDYVAIDRRTIDERGTLPVDLRAFHDVADDVFTARLWRGAQVVPSPPGAPAYAPDAAVRLEVPSDARDFAATYAPATPRIGVLLAGSSPEPLYPPLGWWERLLEALTRAFPLAAFHITGSSGTSSGRTTTYRYPRRALGGLFTRVPRTIDSYDLGLWRQVALLERCDVLIAPHTGFAFLAPCVGTPWLALSGGRWPEYLFNRTPFYCVLPGCPRYPCFGGRMLPDCTGRLDGDRPILCMEAGPLGARIPEIVSAVHRLLDPGFTYEDARALHAANIRRSPVARDRLFRFDGAHHLATARVD